MTRRFSAARRSLPPDPDPNPDADENADPDADEIERVADQVVAAIRAGSPVRRHHVVVVIQGSIPDAHGEAPEGGGEGEHGGADNSPEKGQSMNERHVPGDDDPDDGTPGSGDGSADPGFPRIPRPGWATETRVEGTGAVFSCSVPTPLDGDGDGPETGMYTLHIRQRVRLVEESDGSLEVIGDQVTVSMPEITCVAGQVPTIVAAITRAALLSLSAQKPPPEQGD